jgi:predicted metal-dependent peptidase
MPDLLPPDVEKKILKARIALSLRQPFLASAIMRLPVRDATRYPWCHTMATDGYHIFYNANWVEKLSQAELRGVLAHEVLHVILQHGSRRLNRNSIVWNIAADHAINLLLLEEGFKLPRGGLANPKFKGMSAEVIYSLIPSMEVYKILRLGKALHGSERDDDAGSIPEIGADVIDPDGFGVVGLRDRDMPDSAQLDELCAGLRLEAAEKLQGASAGYFRSECLSIEESRINWRDVLRGWLIERIKMDWSMWPYSKRHIHRGLFMPSIGIEAPGHIVFAVDTSGSMSDADLAEIFTEIRIFRETFPCKLTVVQSDAFIQSITTYEELDGEEVPKKIKVSGGGGTDFVPVFDWISENSPEAYLIYATDGYGVFPKAPSSAGVIWLLSKGHLKIEDFPFGVCVKI